VSKMGLSAEPHSAEIDCLAALRKGVEKIVGQPGADCLSDPVTSELLGDLRVHRKCLREIRVSAWCVTLFELRQSAGIERARQFGI
jgi:hypothetical protein